MNHTIPIAGDFVCRESDQREDGLRQAAFHPDTFDRLKYTTATHISPQSLRDMLLGSHRRGADGTPRPTRAAR